MTPNVALLPRRTGEKVAEGRMRGHSSSDARPLTRRCAPPSPRERGEGQQPVILSAAKDLEMRRPSPPRSFAVCAAQDDMAEERH